MYMEDYIKQLDMILSSAGGKRWGQSGKFSGLVSCDEAGRRTGGNASVR